MVGSSLPLDARRDAIFLSEEAAAAADRRLRAGGGGLVSEDRLRRNLLSSQPMCFNLFGHLQGVEHRQALLPWVRQLSPGATSVVRVEIEWAPLPAKHFGGGSAFDAFIEYTTGEDGLGFVGIECKYHEHLPKTDVKHVRDVYRTFTEQSGLWKEGAVERLDRAGLRQFWLNTLLAQSLLGGGDRYSEGISVVTACAADRSARRMFLAVNEELLNPQTLRWQPWETLLASIPDHQNWREDFIRRYLDFRPIAHLLAADDPRRTPRVDVTTANAIALRVLGDGSVLEQLERAGGHHPLIWSRLALVVEDLKQLRIDAGAALQRLEDRARGRLPET